MEIYLIRHTSVDVPAGYAYGQTDVPLKPTFEEEAEIDLKAVKKEIAGLEKQLVTVRAKMDGYLKELGL